MATLNNRTEGGGDPLYFGGHPSDDTAELCFSPVFAFGCSTREVVMTNVMTGRPPGRQRFSAGPTGAGQRKRTENLQSSARIHVSPSGPAR